MIQNWQGFHRLAPVFCTKGRSFLCVSVAPISLLDAKLEWGAELGKVVCSDLAYAAPPLPYAAFVLKEKRNHGGSCLQLPLHSNDTRGVEPPRAKRFSNILKQGASAPCLSWFCTACYSLILPLPFSLHCRLHSIWFLQWFCTHVLLPGKSFRSSAS